MDLDLKKQQSGIIKLLQDLIFYQRYSSNSCLFKKIISYTFAGFSIIYIAYLLHNILNNDPPKDIGITP